MRRGSEMGGAAGNTASGISLWLVPEGEVGERLGRLIERLAARLGTEPFPPHVTLLPGLRGTVDDVLTATSDLAHDLRPFSVSLSGVEGREEPFRCLYARVAGGEGLDAAHTRAVEQIAPPGRPPFEPHLSLVYGVLDPATKAALCRELSSEVPLSFEVRRLHAWRTGGAVAAWREIASFDLAARIEHS